MEIFHYSETPRGLVSFLQIEKDCYKVLFLDIGLSCGGL